MERNKMGFFGGRDIHCPICGSKIDINATKCKFCGADWSKDAVVRAKSSVPKSGVQLTERRIEHQEPDEMQVIEESTPHYQQKIVRVAQNSFLQKSNLNNLLRQGWRIVSSTNQSQGWSVGKTVVYGALWLPLALKGRKPDVIEYVLEREV